jgi:hypothetical protein
LEAITAKGLAGLTLVSASVPGSQIASHVEADEDIVLELTYLVLRKN